jgi:hypothetical protein
MLVLAGWRRTKRTKRSPEYTDADKLITLVLSASSCHASSFQVKVEVKVKVEVEDVHQGQKKRWRCDISVPTTLKSKL